VASGCGPDSENTKPPATTTRTTAATARTINRFIEFGRGLAGSLKVVKTEVIEPYPGSCNATTSRLTMSLCPLVAPAANDFPAAQPKVRA